ncbi:hypothetical protein DFH08DRAFT_937576 [Mycena albidolilacea]|uniref:Ricin B lectin domain-containing protein n=1 Tax=Mycena albidolilacea TaxID=1033008 RepID=A0AAD6ZZ38_9AGAR|nr:hypothetical protein DFH08DRAFT_937576 [Mycena albidolilacea]
MFSKILTFGIGALALVQGALAIAEGRYIIANPEMGTLVSFHKGDPILLWRAPVTPPLGEDTLFTGDDADTFSIEDAGFDQFVIRVPGTNRVWTAGQIDDPTNLEVHLNADEGENSQRWTLVPL